MAEFVGTETKEIGIDDTILKLYTKKDEKKLKGYQYDSLVYRYIRAREAMAELEWSRSRKLEKSQYYDMAKRDIIRFCEILDETIGEHE
jgi:hypothetical protein